MSGKLEREAYPSPMALAKEVAKVNHSGPRKMSPRAGPRSRICQARSKACWRTTSFDGSLGAELTLVCEFGEASTACGGPEGSTTEVGGLSGGGGSEDMCVDNRNPVWADQSWNLRAYLAYRLDHALYRLFPLHMYQPSNNLN